ncbi:MAG: HypC/HybG/HupF family hydrogenase formation chaperone [Actinomycetota bacterium]|nr:HypC/HybG/HupF family hydrogenase formation chaperone [Actinomycetota bacterium]
MCLGIPAVIMEVLTDRPDVAMVDVGGVHRLVNIGLLQDEELVAQDWVLVHLGFAMAKIDEQEAAATMEFLNGLSEGHADVPTAPTESSVGSGAARPFN